MRISEHIRRGQQALQQMLQGEDVFTLRGSFDNGHAVSIIQARVEVQPGLRIHLHGNMDTIAHSLPLQHHAPQKVLATIVSAYTGSRSSSNNSSGIDVKTGSSPQADASSMA